MKLFATFVATVACAVCVSGLPTTLRAESSLRVGTSIVDITPERLPVSMVGSFTDRKATTVNDPLHARCLVIDDGKTRLALMTVDCCLVSREVFDEAKRRAAAAINIPATHMLMSATHTHTAAPVIDMAQCRADATYNEFLTARLAEGVTKAAEKLQPARISWSVGKLPGEVHNRRWKMKPGSIPANPLGGTNDLVRTNPGAGNPGLIEPAGPTDPEVMLLAATSTAGKPLALYCVYSLHYVGGIPPAALSADYFGEFAQQMRARLVDDDADSPFVALLANGTSGDINNANVRERMPPQQPLEQMRLVAGRLADVATAEFRAMKFHDQAKLRAAETELTLAVRKPSEADIQQARETLATTDHAPKNTVRDVYAGETLALADWPDEVKLKLQTLRIGDLAIATTPCEAFVEIGLEIKRRSVHQPTFVVGLANGYNGYLPTPEHHALGGYETWRSRWSYLEPQASTKIIDALLNAVPSPITAAETAPAALPFSPQVINRLSLDGKPRSLSIRQGADVWLGYDLERATILKAWQAPQGKPGLIKAGFSTRSTGVAWFEDKSDAPWELQRGEKTVPLTVRYLGCSQRKDYIELSWQLQHDTGTLQLLERVRLTAAPVAERVVRELRVENLAVGESLLLPLAARKAWKLSTPQNTPAAALTGANWHRLTLP